MTLDVELTPDLLRALREVMSTRFEGDDQRLSAAALMVQLGDEPEASIDEVRWPKDGVYHPTVTLIKECDGRFLRVVFDMDDQTAET